MNVKRLIEVLQGLNQESEVKLFWDGASRGEVEAIYDTPNTVVLAGEWGEYERAVARRNGMYHPLFEK
jgi:hypothetical protein